MKESTRNEERKISGLEQYGRRIWRFFFNEQFRVQMYCELIGDKNKKCHSFLKKLIQKRLRKKYNIVIGCNTIVGRNLILPHPQNIIIGEGVIIGDNVTIYQDVTIGVKDADAIDLEDIHKAYPSIGNNTRIYAGAKLIGDIEIGDNGIIGCNAVVLKSTQAFGVYAGVPARLLKKQQFSNVRGGVKTLILNNAADRYFFTYIFLDNTDVRKVFSETGKSPIVSVLNKIFRKIGLFYGYCFGDWYERLTQYDKIIVFDNAYKPYLNKMLSSFRGRKVLFFWNPSEDLFTNNNPDRIRALFDSIYSFDKEDCRTYQMEFCNSVYTSQIRPVSHKLQYDICFIGTDKGRMELLRKWYELFRSKGLVCKFYIYSGKYCEKLDGWELGSRWITYGEYLDWISRSKCILDITQDGQNGFSMRVMESIFLKKKLITNNKAILKSDLYHKSNVFLAGMESWDKLEEFMTAQRQDYAKEILDRYDLENWVEIIQ